MSNQSPTGPEPVITMPRLVFTNIGSGMMRPVIEHVEYFPTDDKFQLGEHVWASRALPPVTPDMAKQMARRFKT